MLSFIPPDINRPDNNNNGLCHSRSSQTAKKDSCRTEKLVKQVKNILFFYLCMSEYTTYDPQLFKFQPATWRDVRMRVTGFNKELNE